MGCGAECTFIFIFLILFIIFFPSSVFSSLQTHEIDIASKSKKRAKAKRHLWLCMREIPEENAIERKKERKIWYEIFFTIKYVTESKCSLHKELLLGSLWDLWGGWGVWQGQAVFVCGVCCVQAFVRFGLRRRKSTCGGALWLYAEIGGRLLRSRTRLEGIDKKMKH